MNKLIQRQKRYFRFTPYFIVAAMVMFAACEKDDRYNWQVLSGDDALERVDIMIVSGNYQQCAVNDTTVDSLVVYISKNLIPEPDWPVDFTVISGEGILLPTYTISNMEGRAGTKFVPTGLPGTIKIQALPFNSDSGAVFTVTSTD